MHVNKLSRVLRMSAPEIAWRATATTRIAVDRVAAGIVAPRWDRRALLRGLTSDTALSRVRAALADER